MHSVDHILFGSHWESGVYDANYESVQRRLSGGKHKIHELYMHWLSCKGEWQRSSLCIKVSKSNSNEQNQQYSFLDKKGLIDLYGDVLAADLIQRHKDAEAKLPSNKKNTFIKRTP